MEDKIFNWGVIAPGRISHSFAKAMRVVSDARLFSVASSQLDRAQSFAAEYGCKYAYDDYQTLIEDPNVDVVYIANPHRFHFECIKKCLIAGKPVLCEKPITVNEAQCQELIELANKHQVFLMEAVWTRFLPIWQQVQVWIEKQSIGQLQSMSSSFGFNLPKDESDRLFNNSLAGGALLDMGIYSLTMSQFVMQKEPTSVVANGVIGSTYVDEHTSGTLSYEGVQSFFTCSFNKPLDNNFILSGSKGRIVIPSMFWAATCGILDIDGQEPVMVELPFRATGFEYQIEEVIRCLSHGKLQSDVLSWQDSVATMRIMDLIREQIGIKYPFLNMSDH